MAKGAGAVLPTLRVHRVDAPPSVRPIRTGRRNAYARFVRLLRVLFPTLAAILIGLVVLWPQLAPRHDQFRIGFADLEVTDDGLSMIRPRYVGTDEQSRPFSISASSVRNLVPGGEEMLLDEPEAEITLEDGAWVTVTADTGTYDVDGNALTLTGRVRLYHDKGYSLETTKAYVDLGRSEITGNEQVAGHGPSGYLQGTGFRVGQGGLAIDVRGPARMIINPSVQVQR